MRGMGSEADITAVLARINRGDADAYALLGPLVHSRLYALATHYYAGCAPGDSLQPTALVNEAWLRLVQSEGASYNDRAHFFAVAATAMRHVLVDRARRRKALKRGADPERVSLSDVARDDAEADVVDLLAVSDAIERLGVLSSRQSRIVDLRLFGGLTNPEIAEALSVSLSTIEKEWRRARALLISELNPG
jgi:RNA polymerase sigma factor (TIGR02999 family)